MKRDSQRSHKCWHHGIQFQGAGTEVPNERFTKKRGDKEVRQPSQARKELEHQRNKVISVVPIRTVYGKVAISLFLRQPTEDAPSRM